jgi:ribose 5-phosphate isomerase B
MKIGLVADHNGFKRKQKVIKYLKRKRYDVIDYSPTFVNLDDYTDHAFLLGKKLMENEIDFGIALCGNGIGMSIACNKVKGIRCGKVDNVKEAKQARIEDDINILALSARKPMFEIKDIIDAFLKTEFSTIERYGRRVQELKDYENGSNKS